MINPEIFLSYLKHHDIEFFTGVPDSALKHLCSCITDSVDDSNHIINANEGLAVGLAAGYHLATGKIPCVYMQNAGFGNAINPLLSLVDPTVYAIPMLLLIGWRGEPGLSDEPQHRKQGAIQIQLLNTLSIPYEVLGPENKNPAKVIGEVLTKIKNTHSPGALLVKRNTFEKYEGTKKTAGKFQISRKEAVETIIRSIGRDAIVVATTGYIGREVYDCRERLGMPHSNDFLNAGAMGHCSHIALGIALQRPERQVYCLDGDGAFLMHMGGAAITGSLQPKNLKHILLNNGAHDSVGGQPTVGFGADIEAIVRGCGYTYYECSSDIKDLEMKIISLSSRVGSYFLQILLNIDEGDVPGRPKEDLNLLKELFMENIIHQ